MKLKDYREVKENEVAIVEFEGQYYAATEVNVEGGLCDCCLHRFSPRDQKLVLVRDAVTGDQVWPEEKIFVYTVGGQTYLLRRGESVSASGQIISS